MIELSAEIQQPLRKPVICFFATTMPDCSPQMTQTWLDTDGTYILINTVEGHQKHRNVERDPRVMISVLDPAHLERAVSIRGRVVEITKEGAELHFKQLIKRNMEPKEYRYGKPGQVRILLKLLPKKYGNLANLTTKSTLAAATSQDGQTRPTPQQFCHSQNAK